MNKRYFGTDGIRGKVGDAPITPEFFLKLGWAAGRVLASGNHSKVVIGKDTRISGYMFESALQAGLSAAGVDILLLGPMPTPAIAYLTRTLHAQAGIVISASHNPYYDNGIKFFSAEGNKLPDDIEFAIEKELDSPMVTVDSAVLGKAERVGDARGRYIEFCKSTIPFSCNLKGLKIVVDCANGATYHVAPDVFAELGADVVKIGVEPDGLNINNDCGSTCPERLQSAVIQTGADLGVALDGDGDRVIMVDNTGRIVDGDEIIYIIARSWQEIDYLQGAVVGTVMSNLGLEHALGAIGVELKRAAVGDRYVLEMMREHDCMLGGESSGHILCLDRTSTGDGIVSALQVLAAMVNSGKTLFELKSGMTKYPQCMINVTAEKSFNFSGSEIVQQTLQQIEGELANNGRVLLRASGTEPVIRVMVEGSDAAQVENLAQQLADTIIDAQNGQTSQEPVSQQASM